MVEVEDNVGAVAEQQQPEEQEAIVIEESCDKMRMFVSLLNQCLPNEEKDVIEELVTVLEVDKSQVGAAWLTKLIDSCVSVTVQIPKVPEDRPEEPAADMEVEQVTKEVQVLLTRDNWLGGTKFFEPETGAHFLVLDPETKETEVLSEVESDLPESSLFESVREYGAKEFSPGNFSFCLTKKDGRICLVLLGNRVEPKNMWSGRWKSTWTLENGLLQGDIQASVHYYEEGNIQLAADKAVERAGVAAESLLEGIREAEHAFQLALNGSYQTLSESTFKRLRRQLPITRTKMDWSKVGVYGLGNELRAHH